MYDHNKECKSLEMHIYLHGLFQLQEQLNEHNT